MNLEAADMNVNVIQNEIQNIKESLLDLWWYLFTQGRLMSSGLKSHGIYSLEISMTISVAS